MLCSLVKESESMREPGWRGEDELLDQGRDPWLATELHDGGLPECRATAGIAEELHATG